MEEFKNKSLQTQTQNRMVEKMLSQLLRERFLGVNFFCIVYIVESGVKIFLLGPAT